jgi:acyl carrier protein
MNTQDKLVTLVKRFSKINEIDINPSTSVKELKFDSLDLLEFQMEIDNEFGIELGIEDFLKCITLADIGKLVENYRN